MRWSWQKLRVYNCRWIAFVLINPIKTMVSFTVLLHFVLLVCCSIIIVIVDGIQSSKSTVCTFSSVVFIVSLCSGSQFLHLFIFNNSYSFDTYNYLCTDYPLAMLLLCGYIVRCECNVPFECEKRVRQSQHSSALKNINIQRCVCKFLWINILCLSFEWDKQKRESRRTRNARPKNTRHLQLLAPYQRNHSQSLFYSCSESRAQHFIRIWNFRNNGLISL